METDATNTLYKSGGCTLLLRVLLFYHKHLVTDGKKGRFMELFKCCALYRQLKQEHL